MAGTDDANIPKGPYVYALMDDAGRVFYIGKGRGRRMFEHRKQAIRGNPGVKCDLIRSVLSRGNDIAYAVLDVFDTDEEAVEAEVACIAAHENLTNQTRGGEIGVMSPKRAIARGAMALLARIDRATAEATEFGRKLLEEIERQINNPSPTTVKGHPNIPGSAVFSYERMGQHPQIKG